MIASGTPPPAGAIAIPSGQPGRRVRVSTDPLRDLLGEPPPPGVAALPDAARGALAEVIAAARRKQSDDLAASVATTLRHIPLPLRAVVKRVVLG
jgi:hypothetical protein